MSLQPNSCYPREHPISIAPFTAGLSCLECKGRFTWYDFVAYDKLTTRLRHELLRVNQTYNSLNGPKSCRRPVVSLSYATKSYRVNRPLELQQNLSFIIQSLGVQLQAFSSHNYTLQLDTVPVIGYPLHLAGSPFTVRLLKPDHLE